jgi:D-glycero-beta-D-manno-heptose-7-phosphate kinase
MNTDKTYLKNKLYKIVDLFPSQKILVLGDLIMDEFLYGNIARVSREAPVLVLEFRSFVRLPGGAANAANNLLGLGARVKIAGTIGRDDAGTDLVRMLKSKGAGVKHVHKTKSYATPLKTRILAGAQHSTSQQVLRFDRGDLLHGKFLWPAGSLEQMAHDVNGIIISDYGYGAVTPSALDCLNKEMARHRIPLVVDSRFAMSEYSGATAITPNITELEAATGTSIGNNNPDLLKKVGRNVMRSQKLGCLLVTQGRFGMTLFVPRKPPLHIPIFGSDEVADVTGAGDTVIAVFTLALACGGSPEEAARLANYAGGIVVMKRGTAILTSDELRMAIRQDLSQ